MVQTLSLALSLVWGKVFSFLRSERAQDTFEYLLIIGAVTTLIIAAIVATPGLWTGTIDAVCAAVDGVIGGPALVC